jgi:hypothetical protein
MKNYPSSWYMLSEYFHWMSIARKTHNLPIHNNNYYLEPFKPTDMAKSYLLLFKSLFKARLKRRIGSIWCKLTKHQWVFNRDYFIQNWQCSRCLKWKI